jgi:serine/threonine-protein kinase HipA
MVMGEGRNPSVDHLIKLGSKAKLSKERIAEIIDQTKESLASWKVLASEYGVSVSNISLISKKLNHHHKIF